MLPHAALVVFAMLLSLTFEASYTDASGAHCYAYSVGAHEIDICTGSFNR